MNTPLRPLPSIEPWPLAARLSCSPESIPWTVLVAPADKLEALAEELRDQLASLLAAPVELTQASSADTLVSLSRKEHPIILRGLDSIDASEWRRVDLSRSRLTRTQPAVLLLDERRLPLLVQNAPNFWSWLSGAIWQGYLEGESP